MTKYWSLTSLIFFTFILITQVSKINLPCFIGLICTTCSKCRIELTGSLWQGYSVLWVNSKCMVGLECGWWPRMQAMHKDRGREVIRQQLETVQKGLALPNILWGDGEVQETEGGGTGIGSNQLVYGTNEFFWYCMESLHQSHFFTAITRHDR